jgi:hypothetical protein
MMQDRTAADGGRYTVRGFGPLWSTAGKGRITKRTGICTAAAFQLVIFSIAVAVAGVLNASLAAAFAQLHSLLLLLLVFNAVGSSATAVGSTTAQRGVSVIRHNVHVLHAVARRTSVAADLLLDLQMNVVVLLWRWGCVVANTAATHHSFHRRHSVPTGQNSRGDIEHVFLRRRPMMDIVMMMNTT